MEIIVETAKQSSAPTGGTPPPPPVTTGMNVPVIESEEELAAYLGLKKDDPDPNANKGKGKDNSKGGKSAGNESAFSNEEEEEEEEIDPATGKPRAKKAPELDEQGNPKENGSNEEEEESEHESIVHFLNEKYNLKMNLAALPKDMTREDEATAVASIIEKMTKGVSEAVKKYQGIEVLLQDPEMVEVLQAKAEGKTLKDIYAKYSQSATGMTDDQLVETDLKKRYPKMAPEKLKNMVETMKKSGEFADLATSIREQATEDEAAAVTRRTQEEAQRRQQETERIVAEDKEFTTFAMGIKKIHGVPMNPEMLEELVEAVTVRNEQGQSYLDQMLQSNEGIALATIGILHLKKLLQVGTTTAANRKKDEFVNKLFDNPEKLQSTSTQTQQEDFSAEAANRF